MAVSNFRPVFGGSVYRSGELTKYDPDTDTEVSRAGIKTVVDLRTDSERAAADVPLPGAVTIIADVLADHPSASTAQLPQLLAEPEKFREVFTQMDAVGQIRQIYRELVLGDSARRGYQTLMLAIADPAQRPVLFHCTAGKDRTGWAAAALQLLHGVSEEDIFAGYLESNGPVLQAFAPVLERFAAKGGDPELLLPILSVRADYLQAALDAMREEYQDIDGYLLKGLRLDQSTVDALRRL